jgi:hypothetical protein
VQGVLSSFELIGDEYGIFAKMANLRRHAVIK